MWVKVGNKVVNTALVYKATLYDGNSDALTLHYIVPRDDGCFWERFNGPEAEALRRYFGDVAHDVISGRAAATYPTLAAFGRHAASPKGGAGSC